MIRSERWRAIAAAAILLGVNLFLCLPQFFPGDTRYRDSIEPGYASMARTLSEHPDPLGWNPYQYGGLPMQMWYLPAIPYLGALFIRLAPLLDPLHAYRILAMTLACLGPVTMFLFVRYFTRSTAWAFLTALFYSVASPAYFLYPAADFDRGYTYLPWRLQVLIKYGEGPHTAGLTLLPLALIACWRAATGRQYSQIFLAAISLAAICLTNWVAALALAWCCLMTMVTGAGLAVEASFLHRRLLWAAGLGYLLASFWLTPRFVRTTLFNWPSDAFGYKAGITQYLLIAILFAGPVLIRLAFRRWPRHYYLCFLCLCFYGFFLVAGLHYWLGLGPIPESRRYAVEMEWFFFVLAFDLLRRLVDRGPGPARNAGYLLVGLMAGLSYPQAGALVSRNRVTVWPMPKQESVEYGAAQRLAALNPSGRVFLGGGTRFRANAWFPLQQAGGTFESGLINRDPYYLSYQARVSTGSQPNRRGRDTIAILRTLGVQYLAVHEPGSKEHWRDMQHPEQFEGLLETVHRDGSDVIYRLPFRGFANLIKPAELPLALPVRYRVDEAEKYVSAMDAGDRPGLAFEWRGTSEFEVRGPVPEGYYVSTRVAFDGGWRATQDGKPLAVERDAAGFVLLKPERSSNSAILVRFGPTKERVAFWCLGIASWIAAIAALIRSRQRRR